MQHNVSLAPAVALLLGVTLLAQGFTVRTGTWEFTTVVEGAIVLTGLPENVRADTEKELRKPQVFKSCVTAENLETLNLGKMDESEDEDCKVVSSKMTPTTGDIVRTCEGDEPRTETAHFEAATPQTLRATIASKTAAGTMTTKMTGKWLAAECTE